MFLKTIYDIHLTFIKPIFILYYIDILKKLFFQLQIAQDHLALSVQIRKAAAVMTVTPVLINVKTKNLPTTNLTTFHPYL